jgi:thiol-disulfide isomerase/thioredoxin
MRGRQVAGLLALAVLAGGGGLFAGSFVTHSGPPPWLAERLASSESGEKFLRWWQQASAPATPPGVVVTALGAQVPDLVFVDLEAKAHRLAEWQGQYLLVNFWASWCAPCREEMPALDAARKQFAPLGVEVLGVALDDPDAVRAYLAAAPVSYPVVLAAPDLPNPALALGNTRQVLPYSVLIDRQGRLQKQYLGALSSDLIAQWLQHPPAQSATEP